MNRWLLAAAIVGIGLIWGGFARTSAVAQDKGEKESSPSASKSREDRADDPVKRIDKAIQSYESRADQDPEDGQLARARAGSRHTRGGPPHLTRRPARADPEGRPS